MKTEVIACDTEKVRFEIFLETCLKTECAKCNTNASSCYYRPLKEFFKMRDGVKV